MALWKRLFANPGFERLKALYNDQFPLEVRFVCAEWIEQQIKIEHCFDIHNDPTIEQRAANFMRSLIEQLEQEKKKFSTPDQMSVQYRIEGAIRMFNENLYNSFSTYKQIRDAIMYEQHFLDNFDGTDYPYMDKEACDINDRIQMLQNKILVIKEKQTIYTHDLENFKSLEYNESAKVMNLYPTMCETDERRLRSVEDYKQKKSMLLDSIERNANQLIQLMQETMFDINEVQKVVIVNRLGRWQRDQALAGNGATLPTNTLDDIQSWFEKLAELIWTTRTTVDALRKLNVAFNMNMNTDQFYDQITKLLQLLIISGFIVEKQPPQVMKTNTRFAATVRMLTANVGIQFNNPTVSVSILSESQSLQQQQTNTKALDEASGEILNCTGNLEIQQSSRHLTCNLRNMQLKKIKRAEKRGTESVMDEKFSLLFKSTFQSADVQINAWVMSLPVVVIVHGNQEPQSWATITWDNAFSEICRVPFQVVERVGWSRMADALNTKFASQTGSGLTEENQYYLCEKAFRSTVAMHHEDRPITWSLFCKEPLPDRVFTFWDWFYAIMKLTRDQLRQAWENKLIIGFISKRHAEEKLLKCAPGTFLLRFSDSEIGGITIAWVEQTMEGGMAVRMIQPFTSKDFAIRPLADRIKDLSQCVYLFPDIPKDQAFGAYYTPVNDQPNNGYVKPELKVVVGPGVNGLNSYPNTPQRNWQSPDHIREPASVGSYAANVQDLGPDLLEALDDNSMMF